MKAIEFINSDFEDMEVLLKYAERRDTLCGIKVENFLGLEYKTVKEAEYEYYRGEVVKAMHMILGNKSEHEILATEHTDFVYFLAWLNDWFRTIGKMEKELQPEKSDPLMEEAAGDVLNQFGYLNTLASLSSDYLSRKEIAKEPYEEVYVELLRLKFVGDIQARYNELMQERARMKSKAQY